MSASNWAICPRCLRRAKKAWAENHQRIMDQYGRVPVDEFDALRDAEGSVDEESFRTFREDYEIYGAEDGTVTVSYSGGCSVCGLHLDFGNEYPIPGADE